MASALAMESPWAALAGATAFPGIEVWRVAAEGKPVKSPADGRFLNDDCFVVLHTPEPKGRWSPAPHIHVWEGTDSSDADQRAAAAFAVELDETIRGAASSASRRGRGAGGALIHQQPQGEEGENFLRLFRACGGVKYVSQRIPGPKEGAGPRATTSDAPPLPVVLFAVSGGADGRSFRVAEVALATSSLARSNCFVLDNGDGRIVQWNGAGSSRTTKLLALNCAIRQRDDVHGPGAEILTVNEGDDPSGTAASLFYSALGCTEHRSTVAPCGENGSSSRTPKAQAASEMATMRSLLFEAAPKEGGDGDLQFKLLEDSGGPAGGGLSAVPLQAASSKTFLLLLIPGGATKSSDAGGGGQTYVWSGRGIEACSRAGAFALAAALLRDQEVPKDSGVHVTAIREGSEPPAFRQEFKDWTSVIRLAAAEAAAAAQGSGGSILRMPTAGLSGTPVAGPEALARSWSLARMPSASLQEAKDGDLRVWRAVPDASKLLECSAVSHGSFYASATYVVLYKYQSRGQERQVVYVWRGRSSTVDERKAVELLPAYIGEEVFRSAARVRLVQGKETGHFRRLFKGEMLVHSGEPTEGGEDSGSSSEPSGGACLSVRPRLYRCRATCEEDAAAYEVEAAVMSLASGGAFVLVDADGITTWRGSGAPYPEAAAAERLATKLLAEQRPSGEAGEVGVKPLVEGEEDDAFCEALGGRWEDEAAEETPAAEAVEEEPQEDGPRLFRLDGLRGLTARFQEVFDFGQDDLEPASAMALDAGQEVFVWVGDEADESERVDALGAVTSHLRNALAFFSASDPDVPVTQVVPGDEPPEFVEQFGGWEYGPDLHEVLNAGVISDPYQAKLQELERQQSARALDIPEEAQATVVSEAILQHGTPSSQPAVKSSSTPGVDARKEKLQLEEAPRNLRHVDAPAIRKGPGRVVDPGTVPEKAEVHISPDGNTNFTIAELRAMRGTQAGIDLARKEMYLSTEDFEAEFGITREAFQAMPLWRQREKKRQLDLF